MLYLPMLALCVAVGAGQVAPADPVPAPEPIKPPPQRPVRPEPPETPDDPERPQPPARPQPPETPQPPGAPEPGNPGNPGEGDPGRRPQPPGAPDVPPPPAPPERPTPPPSEPPGPPSSQPVDDATAAWLDRIEARAASLQTLLAKVRYDRREGLLGAEQRRFGTLVYHAGPPAKFDVVFDRAIIDGTPRREEQRWTYDGRWLAERRPEDKVFVRRELAPEGETCDLLRMGDGPFALPLDLDRERTLQRFDVKLVPAAEGDPEDAVHLRLTPREGMKEEAGVEQVDLWYDRQTLLPRRATTLQDAEAGIETVVDLLEASTKAEVDEERFDTMPPRTGWEVQVVPLGE